MLACSYETCDMSHVYHEVCSDFLCDLCECREVDDSCVSGCSCEDQLRLELKSFLSDIFHIDAAVFVHIIGNHVIQLAAEVYAGTVCEVSAVVEAETKDSVARLKHCLICSEVCL